MATMTLKNLPDDLYERLKESAARHHRSINREAIARLERALSSQPVDPEALLERARRVREKTSGIYVTDDDLRQARDEGRS